MDVKEAVTRIEALRELRLATGTITTRTQSKILQSLSDEVLLEVAYELKRKQTMYAPLRGESNERTR